MKKSALFLELILTLIAIIIIASCGSPTDNGKKDGKDSVTTEVPKIPADAVFLTGLYATSTNSPFDQYSPEFLFDSTEKYWATMPGAGIDEGIMMCFNNLDIKSMEVKFAQAEGLRKSFGLEVFVNGASLGFVTPQSNIFKSFNGPANSIYLRITGSEGINAVIGITKSEDFSYNVSNYTSAQSVGIEEIIFKDKNGKKINVIPLKSLQGTATASSVLIPVEAYTTDFLFDSRYDFGWAEGNKEGSGKDETINISFKDDQNISKLKIWNGFQRSDVHYKSNARVKQFEFGTSGNMVSYNLPDDMKAQEITLQKPLKGKEFLFKIIDIYPGASYKDLVISEMQFFTDYGWSVINTGGIEKRKQELLGKIKSTILEKHVDHWAQEVKESYGAWDIIRTTSIILRSNQSFVIWQQEQSTDLSLQSTKTVYDGNWELVSAAKDKATVKIFGKRRLIYVGPAEYKGSKNIDQVTIFSDVLTITPSEIKGEKFIDQIFLK